MTVLRFARFNVEPANVERMLTLRAALVAAIRQAFPGLERAELARLNDQTWMDVWRWDSVTSAQAAANAAPSMPQVAAAVALSGNLMIEHADLVDER